MLSSAHQFYKLALLLINEPNNKDFVIAYKANVFFVSHDFFYADDADDLSEEDSALYSKIKASLPEIKQYHYYDSPENYFNILKETRSDVILASYDHQNKTLHLLNDTKLDPTSSQYLKKLTKELNIRTIIKEEPPYEDSHDEIYNKFQSYEMLGRLPDSLYHGTSLNNARKILRQGLSPQPNKSNFPNLIRHYEDVFLTSDFEKAAFHAWKATDNEIPSSYGYQKRQKDNFGIVFKFKIPDKSKIISDFDAANKAKEYKVKPIALSQELGWVGYRGRIPASFIENIYFINNEGYKTELSKDELLNIDKFGMMPDEYDDE